MAWTQKEIFRDPAITRAKKLISEYRFELDKIPIEITIRLYEGYSGNGVGFEQSHFIHTPTQIGPYKTSCPCDDTESSALHQAVRGFLTYYNEAVKEGHTPDESWLVQNNNFKANEYRVTVGSDAPIVNTKKS